MQAVILAAGQGQRLADPHGRPKCLREVGGAPLVRHQLDALAAVGIDDVVIVVGFGQDQIRASAGTMVRYVVNDRFAETNSMYSFLLARSLVHDDVLVMNSDLFFHPALVAELLDQAGDALLYDSGSGDEEEHMKVRVRQGRLVEMSKTLPRDLVCGENVGMLHLAPATVKDAFAAADAIAANGGERAWLASAINRVAVDHRIRCLDVVGWPWVEIDFPADLQRARTEVLPQVGGGFVRSAPASAGLVCAAGIPT